MSFELVKAFMDKLTDRVVPGNSIVIYKDGKKAFEYSSGYSDVENKVKMTGNEHLFIYSCSKPATVAAAMQLYEKGEFLLSDPLYEYIPEFRDMYISRDGGYVKAEKHIIIRDLFTMTAGLTYDMETPAFAKAKELTNGRMDTLTVIKCLAQEPLAFEPGSHWNYSLCHDVLAAVVEVISGKRFSEYVKENIFDRLDMSDSHYHMTQELKANMAQQYRLETGRDTDIVRLQSSKNREGIMVNAGLSNIFEFGDEYDSGGAGIITTVGDYSKFAAALANNGTGLNKERILSGRTIDLIKQNQLSREQMKTYTWPHLKGYGYGLGVRTMIDKAAAGSNGSVGEFGWCGAAGASLLVDTDESLAVFYAHHMLNPQEDYYQPRLRNVIYSSL